MERYQEALAAGKELQAVPPDLAQALEQSGRPAEAALWRSRVRPPGAARQPPLRGGS